MQLSDIAKRVLEIEAECESLNAKASVLQATRNGLRRSLAKAMRTNETTSFVFNNANRVYEVTAGRTGAKASIRSIGPLPFPSPEIQVPDVLVESLVELELKRAKACNADEEDIGD